MNWRKSNRWLHRNVGFLFFGMAIIYGISGIALNHSVARHWNPDLVQRQETFEVPVLSNPSSIDKEYLITVLETAGERKNYKQYYLPRENQMMIYLKGGHILINLETGDASVTKVRRRSFFSEINFLHYNKPKRLWTWFSDLFGFSMVVLAVTGVIMVRGKKGLSGSGGILFLLGLLVPLAFLVIYLWT